MKFFEQLFRKSEETAEEKEIKKAGELHKDFVYDHDGFWFYNSKHTIFNAYPPRLQMKIRFGFDDPSLLDDCKFPAKIGLNDDKTIGNKYIGFAYGSYDQKDELKKWGLKFPFAEAIPGLDTPGVNTEKSKRLIFKNDSLKKE